MNRPASRNDAIAIAVVGGFVALGSLLPWARVSFISISGTDGDGILTLIAGVVIAVVALVSKERPSQIARVAVLLLFGFSVYIAYNIISSLSFIELDSVASGLWLTFLASALGGVMALVWLARKVTTGASIPPAPPTPPTSQGRHAESP